MLELIRRQQKWLLVIIGLLFVGFMFWTDMAGNQRGGGEQVSMTLYGKNYTPSEVRELSRVEAVALRLGLRNMVEALTLADRRFSSAPGQRSNDFVVNLAILREEAARHGLRATDEEAKALIQQVPMLQVNGQFSSDRWNQMLATFEAQGFSSFDVTTTFKDNVLLEKALALFGAGIRPSGKEVAAGYELLYSTIEGVAFKVERGLVADSVTVEEDEITEFYEENKDSLLSEEQRQVSYVLFPKLDDLTDLGTAERLEKDTAHKKAIQDFSLAVVREGANFAEEVTKHELEAKDSGLVSFNEPGEAFDGKPQIIQAVFHPLRTLENPVSDPIVIDGDTYIFSLVEIKAPEVLSLADAKEQVTEVIQERKIGEAQQEAAEKAKAAAQKAIDEGKDVAVAAEAAGAVKIELPSFQLAMPPVSIPEGRVVAQMGSRMESNALSDIVPSGDDLLFFFCEKKELLEDTEKETRINALTDRTASQDQMLAFFAWFQKVKDGSGFTH